MRRAASLAMPASSANSTTAATSSCQAPSPRASRSAAAATASACFVSSTIPGPGRGLGSELAEDGFGLSGSRAGQSPGLPRADALRRLIESRAIDGLSIGFRTVRARREAYATGHAAGIWQIDLWEISIVTFPMLAGARIAPTAAKPTPRRPTGASSGRSMRPSPHCANPENGQSMTEATETFEIKAIARRLPAKVAGRFGEFLRPVRGIQAHQRPAPGRHRTPRHCRCRHRG